jgi:murein DD-endopeptidase MepM/ murein hydrolase activator NlpD
MSSRRGRRWTVLFVRERETRSHRLALAEWKVGAAAGLLLLVLAAVFVAVGRGIQGAADRARMLELQAAIDRLQQENAHFGELAGRLEHLERAYGQLRRVMGGDVAPSERDVLLPAAVTDGRRRSPRDSPGVERETGALWPLVESSFVTRSFGDTVGVPFKGHVGVDIAVPAGSYVRSVSTGVVTRVREGGEYGLYVRIAHAEGISSLYAHNSWLFVAEGDSVETGEVIALSGNTGRSTAPHLHLEIERDGVPVDPLTFLARGS